MQTLTAFPRHLLTDAQVLYILQEAPAIRVSAGAELLDQSLNVLADISDALVGGTVERNNYADLHGTCTLKVRMDLDWGKAIVRPFLNLSDGTTLARFNLGAYFTNVPLRDVSLNIPINQVQGFDMLHGLASPVGEAYSVAAGTAYLTAIEAILLAQGYTRYVIDQGAATTLLPTDRVWIFDENTKWVHIVNDLLGSIGYQGIWSDWDGKLRCHAYISPGERANEWTYDADAELGMLGLERAIERDYFEAPNRWVYYRSNNVEDSAPVEGDGIYTYINTATGPTSVSARGRVITRVEGVDIADQPSLITRAQIGIDADLRLNTSITAKTSPNPLHWHFDRVYISDPDLGNFDVIQHAWSLPLDGGNMSHEWTVIEV